MAFTNVDSALPVLAHRLRTIGTEVGSRLGERTMELLHQQTILQKPWQREVLIPGRNANIAAQIAETMWVLSGRDDVEWLSHYLPRAVDFSDDGKVWRGAYGPRLRNYGDRPENDRDHPGQVGVDQIRHVVDLLNEDRSSRRAVISIYDPALDSPKGKDIPCNDFLSFISRDGYLHLSVFVRSNDLIWGWSGINAFEWSALQEIIAGILGLKIGPLVFNTTSLHVYDRHWPKARRLEDRAGPLTFQDSPTFSASAVMNAPSTPLHPVAALDEMFERWFNLEGMIRRGSRFLPGELEQYLDQFPEPMMQSWLRVLAWYWSGEERHLRPLEGTRLWAAVQEIPQSIQAKVRQTDAAMEELQIWTGGGEQVPDGYLVEYRHPPKVGDQVTVYPLAHKPAFIQFVDNLHREKSAAYGDSWKKRGEQMSILANIARKVDRMEGGKTTEDETSADTAIDLLVYLIKYRLWLREQYPDTPQVWVFHSDAEEDRVRTVLDWLNAVTVLEVRPSMVLSYLKGLTAYFEYLTDTVATGGSPEDRLAYVNQMIRWSFQVARYLWEQENAGGPTSGYVNQDG